MQPEESNITPTPLAEDPAGSPLGEIPGIPPALEDERQPFWGYADLVLLTSVSFLLQFAGGVWFHFHPDLMLPAMFVVYFLTYLCFRVVFKVKYDRGVFKSLGWRNTGHNLLAAGLGGVLLAIAIGALASFIHTPKVKTPFDDLGKTPLSFALLAVTAICLAPLFEEMFFRGFLQPLLSRTFGVVAGVLVTALLFGGLHAQEYQMAWQYVAAISLLGIVLGVLRARTNSIIPGTVMHGCFNAVSVVALFVSKYTTHT